MEEETHPLALLDVSLDAAWMLESPRLVEWRLRTLVLFQIYLLARSRMVHHLQRQRNSDIGPSQTATEKKWVTLRYLQVLGPDSHIHVHHDYGQMKMCTDTINNDRCGHEKRLKKKDCFICNPPTHIQTIYWWTVIECISSIQSPFIFWYFVRARNMLDEKESRYVLDFDFLRCSLPRHKWGTPHKEGFHEWTGVPT